MTPLPTVDGGWRCIVADPATDFSAGKKSRPTHYERMSDHAVAALPVRAVAAPDAWLFLWATSPKLYRPKGSKTQLTPQEIAEAWGFRYSGRAFVWLKLHRRFGRGGAPIWFGHDAIHKGMGYTTRKTAEDVLLFRRGRPPRASKSVEEVILAALREHSRKPEAFYERVEAYCAGPRLELFARQNRPGWTVWGDQTTHFDGAAA